MTSATRCSLAITAAGFVAEAAADFVAEGATDFVAEGAAVLSTVFAEVGDTVGDAEQPSIRMTHANRDKPCAKSGDQ
jgi:hypothetical protein